MNERSFLKSQACMQHNLFQHVSSKGYCSFFEELAVKFTDEINLKDTKQWEHYWRHTHTTMTPPGLDVKDH